MVLIALNVFAWASAVAAQSDRPGQTFRDCADCPEMVVIPPGSVLIGSSEAEMEQILADVPPPPSGYSLSQLLELSEKARVTNLMVTEHPQHPVTIASRFGLGKYPVTAGEFYTFTHETGYRTGKCSTRNSRSTPFLWGPAWLYKSPPLVRDPAVCITWNDAKAYIKWLNHKLGAGVSNEDNGPYRLPSEAEWEYAARAGTRTWRWWGDAIGVDHAKCRGCQDHGPQSVMVNGNVVYPETTLVGSFPPNPFGLYDTLGDAWQWTEDCWNESYEGAPEDGRPWTSGNCARRAARGGGWNSDPLSVRSARRIGETINLSSNSNGFRLAKTLQ